MSEITECNVERLRKKFKLSYHEATSYLERANGNLVDALCLVESEMESNKICKDEILDKLRQLLEKGNATKIIIRKDGEKFLEVPVTVGLSVSFIIGLISPLFIWFGLIVGAVTSIKVEVVKEDGSVEEVNKIIKVVGSDLKEKAEENIGVFKEKAGEMSENIMSKAEEMSENIKSKANELSENIKVKSGEMKEKAVDGVHKIKDQVQDKSVEAQDEIKKKLSDAKDASGNMFGKLKDKMSVSNLKKDDNSFTYTVDFDDDQIKYNKENDDSNE